MSNKMINYPTVFATRGIIITNSKQYTSVKRFISYDDADYNLRTSAVKISVADVAAADKYNEYQLASFLSVQRVPTEQL